MRFALAVVVGGFGFWLNRFNTALLAEGPEFIFGGAAALLAFVWLGRGPGLLATLISLSALWITRGGAAVVTVVYVLEVWVVSSLYGRTGSLVAASALYWLTIGWVVDGVMYGGVLHLGFPFLMLLLVKQLMNGYLNATVAEATFWLVPSRLSAALGRPQRSERLQLYVFRRVLFVVLLPLFGLTFLYAGVSYERRVDEARAQQLRTASDLRLKVEALALHQNEALMWLGRTVEIERAAGRGDARALLPTFRQSHPDFIAVGITDREGRIVSALPERTETGDAIVGSSAAHFRYFTQARTGMRMSSVPQVIGRDGVRNAHGGPILVMAPPLIDGKGEFDGVVFGVIPHDRLQAVIQQLPAATGQLATLVAFDFSVIASLDPAMPPGTSLRSRLPVDSLTGTQTSLFSYFPPPDGSWASQLQMDQRYSAFQAIPAFDLAVLVDLPITNLQQQMLRVTYWVIGVLVVTLGLAFLVAVLVSRHIAEPLSRVSSIASDIAAGRFPGPAPVAELTRSHVDEVRDLGTHLLTMQDGLMRYRDLSAARERESEERFSATFHQAAVGIAHLDAGLRWQRVNARLCAIVAAPAETLLGQPITAITHVDDREASEQMFRAMLAGEPHPGSLQARFRRGDGGEAVTQLTASLVRGEEGAPKYFILVMEDIADRRRLEAELLQAQKMETVGRLAGGVAHDFNNLLTVILGYGEILSTRLAGDAQALGDLQQIREAGERASRLTRQLLAFARRQVIEPRAIDLNDLVRNMENMLRRLIGEHIELQSRLEEGLDSVRADPGQIEQVVLNLVVNARDAMPDGGRLRLSTVTTIVEPWQRRSAALAPGRYVSLVVSDTGAGMTEEVRGHIFEPFFTTKGKEQGTGLGLATCYGIVKQSGGDIEVESAPGCGTSFSVLLPAVSRPPEAVAERRPAAAPVGRENVLLVEDEPAVARMAWQALQAQGYSVRLAADGEAALALLGENQDQLDLLVTDVVMPRMGGADLAARLRASRPALKVLFTSGYSYEEMGHQGELTPGTAFLQKPFTPAGLARAVREVLDAPSETSGLGSPALS